MLYYQTKFGSKPTSYLEDTTEMVILWLYKPLLWPWHWTQWTNFSAWHSGCCITIPGLVTKCSVVQKISSRQTVTNSLNFCCDLECSNPIFPQDILAYDAVLSNQVWLQTDLQFRRYSRNSHILIIQALAVTLTLKTVNIFFCVTLLLMMLHNHAKFGNNIFCGSEDIIWITFTSILNLRCDLAESLFFTGHSGLWCCTTKQSLVTNRPVV